MTIEQITEFNTELRDALERGAKFDALIELVRESYAAGWTKDEAYETLQQIWLEFGYDDDDHDAPDPKRDELEYLLERVWYWGE
jgi:hypothetical protein